MSFDASEKREMLLPIQIMWYADFKATDDHGNDIWFSGTDVYGDILWDVAGRQYLKVQAARETKEFSYQCYYKDKKFDYYYMSKEYCDHQREWDRRPEAKELVD